MDSKNLPLLPVLWTVLMAAQTLHHLSPDFLLHVRSWAQNNMFFSPFNLHPQIVYKLLSYLFLFFISCYFVLLQKQYQVFFLFKKRKIQAKGFIYFYFCLKKSPTLRLPQNFVWCTLKKTYPFSGWEQKMSFSLPGKTKKAPVFLIGFRF